MTPPNELERHRRFNDIRYPVKDIPQDRDVWQYLLWRFVVKTQFYTLAGGSAEDTFAADEYFKAFKEHQEGNIPYSDLKDGVEDWLRPLDLKLYSALVKKIQAKCTFGSGVHLRTWTCSMGTRF